MRLTKALIVSLGLTGAVQAGPVTLVCRGNLTAGGRQMNIDGETAVVDLERHTFKPPLYSEFPLTQVGQTELSFGSELPTLSTSGNLDRVSGSLWMNVMRPNERKSLQAGGSAHFLAWMSAKCAPAERMF